MTNKSFNRELSTADMLLRKKTLTRHDLINALTQAAQLEHALCCCYLFAGFSLKKHESEGDVTWEELKEIRDWQTQLFIIARQEMGHLGLVCNLLTAIGGAPHFRRPNFPYKSEVFGTLPDFNLEPFAQETIENFIRFESPEHIQLRAYFKDRLASVDNLDEALRIVVGVTSGVMQWPLGMVCVPDSGKLVVSGSAHQSVVGQPSEKRRSGMLELMDRLKESIASTGALPGWDSDSSRPARFDPDAFAIEQHPSPGAATGAAGPVAAAVPVLGADKEVIAVLAFCYETYEHAGEDDSLLWATYQALNSAPFSDLLARGGSEGGAEPWDGKSDFLTIGEFYRHILHAFRKLDKQYSDRGEEFFIGPESAQVNNTDVNLLFPEWFNFDLTQVNDIHAVEDVINEIIVEGEGTSETRDGSSSHYQRLKKVLKDFEGLKKNNPAFDPVRRVVSNPTCKDSTAGTRITRDSTAQVLDVANDSYELMLRVLMRFYARPDPEDTNALASLSQVFLPMMSMVVRTLGEILTEMPAFDDGGGEVAGHGFELHQDLDLMPQDLASRKYFAERLRQLSGELAKIELPESGEKEVEIAGRLQPIIANLDRIAFNFEAAVNLSHENWGSMPREDS